VQTPLVIVVTELKQPLFEPFGRILNPQPEETASQSEKGVFDFFLPFTERSDGWSIGYLEYSGRQLNQLERHPNTPEAFSPLKGDALLVLAVDPADEATFRAFRLEKPIVLNRGVWHGLICLSRKAEILIVENPDVVDEYHKLARPVKGE
jgi:ureidoglycolate hydrolase